MVHQMQLNPGPFARMASGRKTIELRLYDEKRQAIQINDIIEFRHTIDKAQTIRARVTAMHLFGSFEALYASLPLEKCGYAPQELPQASFRDMEAYYPPEAQHRRGVVGIEVRLLPPLPQLVKTSRYLSLLLRHKPQAAGLTLDAHGWADVEELIRCVRPTHFLDKALLEEIVAVDSKQRYAFSPDKQRIRANQGHSIAVDVEPAERIPPEYLWHGTGEKYVESIRATGLNSKGRLFVHLSQSLDTAVNVGSRHGKPFVFRVQTGRMYEDGYTFYQAENGVWLTDAVPAAYLEEPEQIP